MTAMNYVCIFLWFLKHLDADDILKTASYVGSLTLSENGSLWFNLGMCRVLLVFEKKSCKVFGISLSFIRIFWFSTKISFSLLTNLFTSIGFIIFQKKNFFSVTFFFHRFFYYSSFCVFLRSDTRRFRCFVYLFLSSLLPLLRTISLSFDLISLHRFIKRIRLIYFCFLGDIFESVWNFPTNSKNCLKSVIVFIDSIFGCLICYSFPKLLKKYLYFL